MNIYKVLPQLTKKRHLHIWQTAQRSMWSADDLSWDKPHRITSRKFRDQMSRILTPILMGEQAALYSVSSLIPILGHRSEVESQFYLTTWAVDEARHTELFARYYGRIEREPLSIRRFPSGYLFQAQINSKEPAEWLAGVLVSEVLAKLLMEEFKRLDLDPVLSDIADGILGDEARHLGFNHIYLEDYFCGLYLNQEQEGEDSSKHLHERLQLVMDHVSPNLEALDTELKDIGIDRHEVFHHLQDEAKRRLARSIKAGRRVADQQIAASRLEDAAVVGA